MLAAGVDWAMREDHGSMLQSDILIDKTQQGFF